MLKKSINLLMGLALLAAPVLTSCDKQSNGNETPEGKPLGENTIIIGSEEGAVEKVNYTFESSWQVNNGLKWVKVTPLSGFSGDNEITITTLEANEELSERVGYFSLAVNGGLIKNWVVQEGKKGLDPVISVVGASADAATVTVNVNGNMTYEVSTEESWLTLGEVSYADSVLLADNATRSKYVASSFTAELQSNSGELRTADIILTAEDGSTYNVSIQQMGELVADFSQDFLRRSLAIRFTATWCGYCPTMAASIDMAIESCPERIIPFTLHATNSDGGLAYSGTNNFASLYSIEGYPTGIMNGYAQIENYPSSTASKMFVDVAEEAASKLPSKTNIGGFVSVSGGNITVSGSVAIKEAGDYAISVFILEDDIIYNQASGGSDYQHNYVVRKDMAGIYGTEFSASANSYHEFNFTAPVPSNVKNESNLHVVIYVTYDGTYAGSVANVIYDNYGLVIDNVVDIKANDLCVFKYEE